MPLLAADLRARLSLPVAAQAMGADFAYIGSLFIATAEANAADAYKQMIVDSSASDIVYSNLFTGVHGNYLRPSIAAAGLDPDALPEGDVSQMSFSSGGANVLTRQAAATPARVASAVNHHADLRASVAL